MTEESHLLSEMKEGSIEDIERRLASLRNPTAGLLDVTKINPRENLLSEEDKAKEIEKVNYFIKTKKIIIASRLS